MMQEQQFLKSFSGPALAAVVNASRDPSRHETYEKAKAYALGELKYSAHNAHMFAKYHSSPWNALSPRENALLPLEATRLLTDEVIQVARRRLNGVSDLVSRGLTRDAGNVGNYTIQWQTITDLENAEINMDGRAVAPGEQPGYGTAGVPMPIIHKDFELDFRQVMASQNAGAPLDTTLAQRSAQIVADGIENMLFNGSDLVYAGLPIYGYTTHPNRITETTALGFDTIGNVTAKILLMIAAASAKNHFGPFVLYVSPVQYAEMLAFHTDGSGQTALQRALQIEGLEAIKQSNFLAAGSAVLVEMLATTVQLAIAEDIRTNQWDNPGGLSTGLRIWAAQVPILKVDSASQMGIVHGTGI